LPHTYVGRWLRALMLDQRELRDELIATLNNGEAVGWNDDEPAVVVACCELTFRRCWPDGPTRLISRRYARCAKQPSTRAERNA